MSRAGGLSLAALASALCLAVAGPAVAQIREHFDATPPRQGAFTDASFEMMFRRYTPPANPFSPFYAWDAHMALRLTIVRRGAGAVDFSGTVQSVGTESFGSRVSVGGAGYLLGFSFTHTHSADLKLSAGIAHLSSHLTRDLDEKLDEQRGRGTEVPDVIDPSDYNVIFFKVARKLPAWRLSPEVEAFVQPFNIRLRGGLRERPRLVHLRTRATLWQAGGKRLAAETQHEIGSNTFHHVSLVFEHSREDRPGNRLQIFLSVAPGRQLHVSPIAGGLRDGVAAGVKINFRS
jgi:hypothetical protein